MNKLYLYISFLFSIGIISSLFGKNTSYMEFSFEKEETISAISIFAGNDTSICHNSYLDLTQLGAYINGDVNDGIWISYGDGTFTPGDAETVVFSQATGYTLGADDISNGSVTLILVSDDPDGFGPETEVSDFLVVTLIDQPAMACVGTISLSLDNNCTQTLVPQMLLTNPVEPYSYYSITSYDESGNLIPNNILTGDLIGQEISFTVNHDCGDVSCSGTVSVWDNHIPNLICDDQFVVCSQSTDIDDIGLPIPSSATVVSHSGNEYIIDGFDPCSTVTLAYSESTQQNSCADDYSQVITRLWQATDESNNITYCTQSIYIERITLADVILPPSYDGINNPMLSCNQVFDTLDNGAPTPAETGFPDVGGCSDIDAFILSDVIIPDCGAGYKVLRKWYLLDNCTSENIEYNQLIKIADTLAPIIDCPNDTLKVSTSPYNCRASFEVPLLDYDDCSEAVYSISYLTNYTGDTIPINELFTTVNLVNQGDTLFTISNLPLGDTWIKYKLEDECLNRTTCFRLLQVEDNVAPYVACKSFVTVNLTEGGVARLYAPSLDNNSWDNCSDVSFGVRKMTDICGSNSDQFTDYIDFCCAEVGQQIMVSLEVTDEAGNVNYCMVEVSVLDKLPPSIYAPSDITISCQNAYVEDELSVFGEVVTSVDLIEDIIVNDALNSGVVGSDGLASDNCEVTVTEDVVFDIECEQGTIVRTFTATDGGGLQATDQQVITIVNPDPFDEDNIIWPIDKTFEGCTNLEVDTSDTPVFNNIFCGVIAATHEDQIFEVVEDACVKILRHWTVVDWCQYDENDNSGLWTHTQVIKILNHNAPEIINCADTTYCLYEEDCSNGDITISIEVEDDCTAEEDLHILWTIRNSQNQVISNGASMPAILNIATGDYSITWVVEDLCGNSTTCSYNFDVKDCKAPTPYCYGNLVTTLMNNTNSIEVWASDFNINSYDNCTAQEDLVFSFSSDTTYNHRLFDCNSIENGIAQNFELDIWVTDEFGNQDYCTVQFFVQDNQDNCDDQTTIGAIGGNIMTVGNDGIDGVQVDIECILEEYSSEVMTNSDGEFLDAELLQEVTHTVRPYKDNDYLNGVSTLDLIKIQRHILYLDRFDSPYKIIAADINGSRSINAVDIIQLRKLLLGKYNSFPQNTSWRFIASDYSFGNDEYPWYSQDSIVYNVLDQEYLTTDFIGVKIGDVNSFYTNFIENKSETRNSYDILQSQDILPDGTIQSQLTINTEQTINGYQLEIKFDASSFEFVGIGEGSINNNLDNYNIDNTAKGVIRLLWYESQIPIQGCVLSSLRFKAKSNSDINKFGLILNERYDNELYLDENVMSPVLIHDEVLDVETIIESVEIDIFPNPFFDNLNIDLSTQFGVFNLLKVYNTKGELLFQKNIETQSTIILEKDIFSTSGTYFIQLIGESNTVTKKVLRI